MTMIGASTGLGRPAPAAGGPPQRARSQALGRMFRAVRSNRKATAGSVLLAIFALVALVPGVISGKDPSAEIYGRSLGPSLHHLLGTTAYGQDLFAQTVWGARQSLIIALSVGAATTVLAVIVGVAAAYLGGVSDGVLSLITDVLLVIPLFPLLIVIAAYARNGRTLVLIIVLTLTEWSFGARQLRSQALSLRTKDFLEAARVRGERSLYIIVVEIIPTMTSLIVSVFLSSALYALLFASSLQSIGLGHPNSLSGGRMLYWAENNEALQTGQYLWAVAPGVCIAALAGAFPPLNSPSHQTATPP